MYVNLSFSRKLIKGYYEGFVTHEVGSKYIAVATGKASNILNGMLRYNETANFILNKLMNETTEEQIVDAMAEEYDATKEVIAADVHKIVGQLRDEGLLDE